MGLRAQQRRLQPAHLRQGRRAAAEEPAGDDGEVAAKITKAAGGPYGIGVRGSRSWATIHPGFLSGYTNYGGSDFELQGGKLKPAMNSPESKEFTKLWVEMIQKSGPKNWATYTWYQVGTDLGAGASAMIYDADILGYFMNGGDNKERGQPRLRRLRRQSGGEQADRERVDLVAGDVQLLRSRRTPPGTSSSGRPAPRTPFGARKMDLVNPVRDYGVGGSGVQAQDREATPATWSSTRSRSRRRRRSTSRRSRCSST